MECGVPFCHHGCPLGNLIPDWNDLVYRDRLARGDRAAAPHEQLPRVHRPPLPRAVRGGVRARDRRGRRRHDQADRARDRRPRVGRGLDRRRSRRARAPGRTVAVVGSGPAGLACAQQLEPRRPHGDRARARRGGGRARPLRRARLQDREVARRAARASSSIDEGVEFRYGVDVGVDVDADELRASLRRGRGRDRLARAARPAGAGPRARRRPLRDGVPLPAQPLSSGRRPAHRVRRRSRPRPAST